jgi:hypothetical protein
MRAALSLVLPVLIAAGLAACSGGSPADGRDAAEAGLLDTVDTPDPVIAAALEEPIMVDPSLASQANGDAIRPPAEPYAAPVAPDFVAARPAGQPETLISAPRPGSCPRCAALAASETLTMLAEAAAMKPCGPLAASARWAARLPADLPLHPAAAVSEAAGIDAPSCRMRAVSYSAPIPMATLIDWTFTRADKAGFAPRHESDGVQHVLTGKRGDGAAFTARITARGADASDMDLIVRR